MATLAENTPILTDLYALSSCFYIKGIVDANRVCDPFLVEDIYKREDTKKLMVVMGYKKVELEEKDYIKIVVATASSRGLFAIRNWLLKVASKKIKKAVCFLMDFLYRQGLRKQSIYDGGQPENMLNNVNTYMIKYNTPEGEMTQSAWHDLIRQYILQVRLDTGFEEMNNLDEFMAITLKNDSQIQEAKRLYEQRRKYILSGGGFPGKSS